VLLPSTWNCTLVVLAETLVVTVTVPDTVAPEAGEVIEIVGAVALFTVTATPGLVVVLFEVSLATAVSVCVPWLTVVVFHEKLYGDAVTALPTLLPSTWNCTLAMPTLELAVALTVTAPETVAPAVGAVIETVGAADCDGLADVSPMHPLSKSAAPKHKSSSANPLVRPFGFLMNACVCIATLPMIPVNPRQDLRSRMDLTRNSCPESQFRGTKRLTDTAPEASSGSGIAGLGRWESWPTVSLGEIENVSNTADGGFKKWNVM